MLLCSAFVFKFGNATIVCISINHFARLDGALRGRRRWSTIGRSLERGWLNELDAVADGTDQRTLAAALFANSIDLFRAELQDGGYYGE